MTKIEITGKVIPSGVLDKKFVQGENKMEKILFALPLNYGGVDMSAMNYTLRLANVAGTVTSAALVKTVADKVNLEWTVTEDFVRMPGNCRIELDGVDAEGAHKFLAVSAWFDVLKNLGHGSNLPPKDEITAALESMQVYLSGAADSAAAAKKWADQSAAAAAEIEQQLQDAEDVTQALTDKTAEAQGVVDELGDMLAEADLSDFVRKTGTSVVTGDLQVPTPATEGSAVNRGYADKHVKKTGDTMSGILYMSSSADGTESKPIILKLDASEQHDKQDMQLQHIWSPDGKRVLNLYAHGTSTNQRANSVIIRCVDDPENDNEASNKHYADSVPYTYAKAAGCKYSEDIFKKNISKQPFIAKKTLTTNEKIGYVQLAKSETNAANNESGGMLIVHGFIRDNGQNGEFTILINNRSPERIVFYGWGSENPFTKNNINVVVQNNANKAELYFVVLSGSNVWLQVEFELYTFQAQNQWTVNENAANLSITEGTIPGTKVWDLKTAWGNTSRTQMIKEDIYTGISPDIHMKPNGTSRSYGIEFDAPDNAKVVMSTYSHNMQAAAPYDGYPIVYFFGMDTQNNVVMPILEGVGTPKGPNSATNKKYVDDAIVALEAKLTGKTVSEVLAANSIASSIPAAAPSLEISEEEEEITV